MVELLAPAGSPEAVTAAVQSGANAVYLSFEDLTGCRRTENIPNSEFESVVRYCRIRGCRAYLALNIPVREDELNKAAGLALRAQRCGVDAIIVRDLGLFRILRSLLPEMPLFADERGHRAAARLPARFPAPRSPARGYPPHGAVPDRDGRVGADAALRRRVRHVPHERLRRARERRARPLQRALPRAVHAWRPLGHNASELEGPLHASRVPGSHRRGRSLSRHRQPRAPERVCLRVHGRVGDRHPRKPAARRAGAGAPGARVPPVGRGEKRSLRNRRSAGEDPRRDRGRLRGAAPELYVRRGAPRRRELCGRGKGRALERHSRRAGYGQDHRRDRRPRAGRCRRRGAHRGRSARGDVPHGRNAVPLHRGARAVSRGRKAPGIRYRTGRGPPPSFV